MVIFDCDDFQVVARDGERDVLLITFAPMPLAGARADGRTFWARPIADSLGISAIGFVARARDWYCSPHMAAACDIVAARAGASRDVVTYGAAMGGYAALRWAARLGATAAIAFAPQYSIEPAIVGSFDRRHAAAFDPVIHGGMRLAGAHADCPCYLLLDPTVRVDRRHAALIVQAIAKSQIVPLEFCGSGCVRVFADPARAGDLIRHAAAGQVGDILRLARITRRRSAIRAVELARRLLPAKPAIAERLFLAHAAGFDPGQTEVFQRRLAEARLPSPDRRRPGDAVPTAAGAPRMARVRVADRPSSRRRLIHMHIPKTAGSALRDAFRRAMPGARIFPEWDEAKYAGIDPTEFDFYSGHFGFETASRLDGDIVTVLRDPVDRFVSVYHFWRQLHEGGIARGGGAALAHRYSLEAFVELRDEIPLIAEFRNRCTLQVAHGSSLHHRHEIHRGGTTDDALFATAVENMRGFAAVGLQEDLAGFGARVSRVCGLTLDIRAVNVTRGRPPLAAIPMVVRRRIQEWVSMDLELYHEAIRLASTQPG